MSAGVFDPQRRGLTLGIVIAVILVAFEAMAVATILPTAAEQLGGLGAYGWAFSTFMLANLVGSIAAGQLADRMGPSLPLWAGAAAICTGLVIAGFAPAWSLLLVGRALQGLGGGAVIALAYLGIRRGYPGELHPRMMAIVSSAWVLPSLLGPLAAGFLAVHLSWRWVFLLLLVPPLRRMPPLPSAPRRGRVVDTILLSASLAALLSAMELRTLLIGPALVGAAILAVFFARRILPPGTLRARPGLPAGLAFRALLSFVFFGAEAFVPLGLSALRDFSPTQAGLVLTGASFAWTAGSWTQARLESRDGGRTRKVRLMGGFGLVTGGIAAMGAVALLPSAPVALSTLSWAVAGYGMGLAYPTVSVIVLGAAPAGEEGWVASSLNLMENVGIALGAGLAGAVFDAGGSFGVELPLRLALTYGAVAAPFAVGLYVAARIFSRPRPHDLAPQGARAPLK